MTATARGGDCAVYARTSRPDLSASPVCKMGVYASKAALPAISQLFQIVPRKRLQVQNVSSPIYFPSDL